MKKFIFLILLIPTVIFLFSCNPTPPVNDSSTDTTTESVTTEKAPESTTGSESESTASPNVPEKPSKKSIKILAIGNSFSVDAMEHLAVILKGEGYESFVLGNLYIGGCSIDTHASNIITGAASYDFYTNTGGVWSSVKRSITDGITYDDWDIITLQQVSGSSGVASSYSKLQGIIDYVKSTATNPSLKIYWHMTWAYQNGSSHASFKNYGNDQNTMYKAIVSTVLSNIFTNSDISGIIPSGTAIQNLRTSYLGDTLTRDGYHLSYDIGRYTAALMWYKYITGNDISDVMTLPLQYPGVAEHLDAIKEAVNCAYEKPFEITQSTKTEKETVLLQMTDADRAHLVSLGLDPEKYTVLDINPTFNAYYLSTSSADLVTTAANSPNFFASAIFTPQTLPAGSVINIGETYKYRIEGWQKINQKNSLARLDATSSDVILDASYYERYNFLAFNVSRSDGANVSLSDKDALRVYVPIPEKEDLTLTANDKAYLESIGLDPDSYEKIALDYTLFAYYNMGWQLHSIPNGTRAANLVNFITTRKFTKNELPIGSVIRVDQGYQYRAEGWQTENQKNSATRPSVTVDNFVYVDSSWWGNYNYRAFNVSVSGASSVVSFETGSHFVIYVLKSGATPKAPTNPQ